MDGGEEEVNADDRKMEITWKTTPAELRVIADALEREGCNQVRVNWYHTRLCFVSDVPQKDHPQVVELQGEVDGSISRKDVSEKACCEIIEASAVLSKKDIRRMIEYMAALLEQRTTIDDP